ncbi:MAG: DNA polymerase IV [Bacilli bacterium]|nr:DNA polymerase IV [Bacilli bacterium]
MQRIIMHIDVNNAFLSWTAILLLKQGYKYDIRKSYAVIGFEESKRHGIVLSKSTPIKKLGVKTAEPIFMAKKKCPNLKVYKPNYEFYKKMSNAMFDLIKNYTPDIEKMSIDECFLDYGPIKHLYGDEIKFAYKIKNEIKNKLGFTVNVGVANNKLCAKMASDFTKPDRVHTLFEDEVDKKMKPLPIEDLFFIGKKTSSKLHKLGIHTIYDLSVQNLEKLYPYFKNQAYKMISWANGIDDSLLETGKVVTKGISNSTTLIHNLIHKEDVYEVLESISENLARQLRREKRYASVVRVQLKNSSFQNYTHQKKLENATNSQSVIFETAKKLCDDMWKDEPIRLVGLGVDGLTEEMVYQTSLFDEVEDVLQNRKLDEVLDNIKNKFGFNIIDKASMSGKKKIRKKY